MEGKYKKLAEKTKGSDKSLSSEDSAKLKENNEMFADYVADIMNYHKDENNYFAKKIRLLESQIAGVINI